MQKMQTQTPATPATPQTQTTIMSMFAASPGAALQPPPANSKMIPFINKYQPSHIQDFEQLDADIVTLLKSLIAMNNLNIMFYGDAGSGKTSLINSVICEYYGTTRYNPDNVLVLNSLKDQGIQFYRNDVKIFCQTCSLVPGKKKFVLLDDLDLINEQSQQVFRNCMDKYSHNVHFISSCSNVQKVIDSLQSRNIIIKINQLNNDCLYRIMHKIKVAEDLVIDANAERFILNISNGSVRILINYLEKIKILGCAIDIDLANKLCSNISFHYFQEYTACVLHAARFPQDENAKLADAIRILYELHNQGYSVMDILDNYFLFIKTTDMIQNENKKYEIIALICKYITIFHNVHEDEIELALFTNNIKNELDVLR